MEIEDLLLQTRPKGTLEFEIPTKVYPADDPEHPSEPAILILRKPKGSEIEAAKRKAKKLSYSKLTGKSTDDLIASATERLLESETTYYDAALFLISELMVRPNLDSVDLQVALGRQPNQKHLMVDDLLEHEFIEKIYSALLQSSGYANGGKDLKDDLKN
jgi:hypothetical protein